MAGKMRKNTTRTHRRSRTRTRTRTQRRRARGGGYLSDAYTRASNAASSLGKNAASAIQGVGRINPMTIQTALAKLDALIIHQGVPFVFSDGTMASQYKISVDNPATRENGGRGSLPYTGTRGKQSGFFSGLSSRLTRTQNSAAGNRLADFAPPGTTQNPGIELNRVSPQVYANQGDPQGQIKPLYVM